MIVEITLALSLAVVPQDTSGTLAHARALLESGNLAEARTEVTRLLRHDRDNYDALMLLGRVHLAWPTIGRFDAWRTFRRAAEIRPDDPEPYFWQALVGERLGGADGERMIREGILRVWERDPAFPYTWELWRGVYRGPDQNLEAAAVLARHSGNPTADVRRVRMLIEAERFSDADTVLERMIADGRDDAMVWALAAEAAFMREDTLTGIDAYERALERVDSDSLGYLWEQVEPIASPVEIANHDGIHSPAAMGAFYRAFWEKREPDLTTETNERIAEHFVRLRDARRQYRIRHPQAIYHRSARWRSIAAANIGRVQNATGQFLRIQDIPLDGNRQAGVADPDWDVGVREPDSLSRYRRYGLDGRGLVLLRFGKPVQRMISAGPIDGGDVESWTYELDGELQVLTFARASGFDGFGGEMVFFPTSTTEAHNSELMLERDETAVPAELEMAAWAAFFRAPDRRSAFVYVRSEPDGAAVRIWDAGWRAISSATGRGPLVLQAAQGRNTVGIDVREGDRMARLREEIVVPRFSDGRLSVSSLIIARSDSASLDRDAVARLMPADLTYPADSALSIYTEIYDLTPQPNGSARYAVDYVFLPEDDQRDAVSFAFEKTVPSGDYVEDRLVILPGRVPAGVYRVILRVRDLVSSREVVQTRLDVALR